MFLESYTRSNDIVEGENADDLRSIRSFNFEEVLARHHLWTQAEQNSDASDAFPSSSQPDEDQSVYSYMPPVPQIPSSNGSNPGFNQGSSSNFAPNFVLSVERAVVGDDGSMQFLEKREELKLKFNQQV